MNARDRAVGRQEGARHLASLTLHDITWIVTYQCHLNCRYCYVPTTQAQKASDSTLSKAQVCDILAQARSLGASNFMPRGGEPFLRNDLVDILETAELLGFRSELITKVALSKSHIARLAALEKLSLGVSLDTTELAIGDALLNKVGQTSALMRSIARLGEAGQAPTVEATVTRATFPTLDALEAFCRDAGAKRLHLREVAPHKVRRVDDLLLDQHMIKALNARAGRRNGLEITITPAFSLAPSCCEGLDALTFLPGGQVTKCTASLSRHPKMHYGDLSRQTIVDVLTGQRRAKMLRQVVSSGDRLVESERPTKGRLPCSQLVALRFGDPYAEGEQ